MIGTAYFSPKFQFSLYSYNQNNVKILIYLEFHKTDVMVEPIFLTTPTGYKIRILSPSDYDLFDAQIEKPYLKTIFHVSFWSGMRYVEVKRFHSNPDWWQKLRKTIYLPKEANLKVMRVAKERYITPIPSQLEGELPYFFKNQKPPTIQTWDDNLKRWADHAGLGIEGITAKMTRATIESWMCAAKIPIYEICLRQGHTVLTSMNHYLALPFTDVEKIEINKRLAGWK